MSNAEPVKRRAPGLSAREAEILRFISLGETNRQIGLRFCIAETTVKAHAKSIFRKIGVSNRTQAALWALDHQPVAVRQSLLPDNDPDIGIVPDVSAFSPVE
jgi:DNA-binding NarL/FixJ family response regulator